MQWENDEKTIVRWTFEGVWTWGDFRVAQAELHNMIRYLGYQVDVIADMRRSPALPRDTFHNFKSAELKALPNRDRVVLVGGSFLVRGMASTFNQVFRNRPTRFLLADTVEEAQSMLAQPRHAGQQNVPVEDSGGRLEKIVEARVDQDVSASL